MKKLIIIRGNSGSGKSTVARRIREELGSDQKIAIVEQDYLRRFILKEKEVESENNVELIKLTVLFALEKNYDVILEGILNAKRYTKMINELIGSASKSYIYYMDVSFSETLKRHKTKPNKDNFGEEQMRQWYKKSDLLGADKEKILPETLTEAEMVQKITNDLRGKRRV